MRKVYNIYYIIKCKNNNINFVIIYCSYNMCIIQIFYLYSHKSYIKMYILNKYYLKIF